MAAALLACGATHGAARRFGLIVSHEKTARAAGGYRVRKAEPPPATTGRSSDTAMRVLRPATVVTSDSAMVVSASPYATEAGLAVLR